jgi:hypothetical protein
MMAARVLMLLGASIILALGVIHLTYTFWGASYPARSRGASPHDERLAGH